jgi:hypothetical protein
MRIDELLNERRENITESQYQRLKVDKIFTIEFTGNDWNFKGLDKLTEPQARRLLRRYQKARKYEEDNNVQPPIREVIVNLSTEPEIPEQPENLKGYDTPHIFAAYLQHKFNISI